MGHRGMSKYSPSTGCASNLKSPVKTTHPLSCDRPAEAVAWKWCCLMTPLESAAHLRCRGAHRWMKGAIVPPLPSFPCASTWPGAIDHRKLNSWGGNGMRDGFFVPWSRSNAADRFCFRQILVGSTTLTPSCHHWGGEAKPASGGDDISSIAGRTRTRRFLPIKTARASPAGGAC